LGITQISGQKTICGQALAYGQFTAKGLGNFTDGSKLRLPIFCQGFIETCPGNSCLFRHLCHPYGAGHGVQGAEKVLGSPIRVLYHITDSRGAKVLKEVLVPAFNGVIGTDDHSAYSAYHKKGKRQLCWAHLIRKFKALKEKRGSPDAYIFSGNMLP